MRTLSIISLVLLCSACSSTKDGSGTDAQIVADTTITDTVSTDVSTTDAATPDITAVEDTATPKDTANEDTFNPDAVCGKLGPGAPCDLDDNPCTLDECNDQGQCEATNQTEDCADEQAQQPCWTWTCNPKGGCTVAVFVEDLPCDDGNACTEKDKCQSLEFKTCLGSPIPVDDGNPCTLDQCVSGTIKHDNIEGKPCEVNGQAGLCAGGVCTPKGDCTPPCPADTTCINGECKPTCTPTDGGWSEWMCTPCSKACGGGVISCTRQCTNPAPACGGQTCSGPNTKEETCNTQDCNNNLPLGSTQYSDCETIQLGTVPGGVTSMDVTLWGAGGGGGKPGTGGGGAMVQGNLTVQPGDKLEMRVACAGRKHGGGGGASYVFVNGQIVMVAAGGGGAGSDGCSGCHLDTAPIVSSGGGGGAVGQKGQDGAADNTYKAFMGGGQGATASAGGPGGVANNQSQYNTCKAPQGPGNASNGEAGSAHTGGREGSNHCKLETNSPPANYHNGGGNDYGNGHSGGGGSGYFGGGSGAFLWTYNGGGGGGGSSWVDTSKVSLMATEGGNWQTPGGTGHPQYQNDAGRGGNKQTPPNKGNQKATDGNPGLIIVVL